MGAGGYNFEMTVTAFESFKVYPHPPYKSQRAIPSQFRHNQLDKLVLHPPQKILIAVDCASL